MEKYGLTLKYSGMDAYPEDMSATIFERLSGLIHIDKDNGFLRGDEPHTAVAIVLSRSPFPGSEREKGFLIVSGEENNIYTGYEDESGAVHDVRDCKALTPSRHAYGCIYNREDGTTWLFVPKASDEFPGSLINAESVRAGEYAPIRVSGQSDYCADHFGIVGEIDGPSDGEFVFSGENEITILGIPWMGGNKDKELVEALEEALIDHEAALDVEAPSISSFG